MFLVRGCLRLRSRRQRISRTAQIRSSDNQTVITRYGNYAILRRKFKSTIPEPADDRAGYVPGASGRAAIWHERRSTCRRRHSHPLRHRAGNTWLHTDSEIQACLRRRPTSTGRRLARYCSIGFTRFHLVFFLQCWNTYVSCAVYQRASALTNGHGIFRFVIS